MSITRFIIGALCIFFFLQLIFARGGIIHFAKTIDHVDRLHTRTEAIQDTQEVLLKELEMATNNLRQQKVHANRVGLLASDEILFQTHPPLFSVSPSYYPGTIYIPTPSSYSSIPLLFVIACSLQLIITSIVLVRAKKKSQAQQANKGFADIQHPNTRHSKPQSVVVSMSSNEGSSTSEYTHGETKSREGAIQSLLTYQKKDTGVHQQALHKDSIHHNFVYMRKSLQELS